MSNTSFAELLYCQDHESFVSGLNSEYASYDVDFTIRLSDRNVRDCFYKTLESVTEKYDGQGFYKALHSKDEFALAVDYIVNYNFSKVEFRKITDELKQQLTLF